MSDIDNFLASYGCEISYLFLILTTIIFARYLLLSSLYHKYIYQKIAKNKPNRIISKLFTKTQINKEILWSGISAFIFGLLGALVILAFNQGYTSIYTDFHLYGWWYLPLSLILIMVIHETYYYWLHRWLHIPSVYKYIHQVHHNSVHTSAWTSFSFHPIESVLQAIIIPVILWAIPLHYSVVFSFLLLMTISAIINHAGVEIYPSQWARHPVMQWFIGATHHDVHHRKFTQNFGLYFTFWDRWMNTENEDFTKQFESITFDD